MTLVACSGSSSSSGGCSAAGSSSEQQSSALAQGERILESCTAPSLTVTANTGTSGSNSQSVTVNGSFCDSSISYVNEPCTSVTICQPGTGNCQTITNILVDTGSYGLRIFSDDKNGCPLIGVTLTQENDSITHNPVAECAEFGTGAAWGPVQLADVVLGGETKISNLPIQVINSSFADGGASAGCGSTDGGVDTGPADTGFNGILGVGVLADDSTGASYWSCNGTTCGTSNGHTPVKNPVVELASDGNGVVMILGSVPSGGSVSLTGELVFGISTNADNTPGAAVNVYEAGTSPPAMLTTFSGTQMPSFLDSGSNALYFTDSSFPQCSGWYCPSTDPTSLSAINVGSNNKPTGGVNVGFLVANAQNLFNNNGCGNYVFSDLAAAPPADLSGDFDWGLPFFLGQSIYVGVAGTSANINGTEAVGPYWAY